MNLFPVIVSSLLFEGVCSLKSFFIAPAIVFNSKTFHKDLFCGKRLNPVSWQKIILVKICSLAFSCTLPKKKIFFHYNLGWLELVSKYFIGFILALDKL